MKLPRVRPSSVWLPVLFLGLLAFWVSLSSHGDGARATAGLPGGLHTSLLVPGPEGGALFLCGDGESAWACRFDSPDQSEPASAQLASPPSLAYGEDGNLCLFYAYSDFGTLLTVGPDLDLNAAETDAAIFFADLPASYACAGGWLYAETSENIAAYPPDGSGPLSLSIQGRLFTAPDGEAFAWTGDVLYRLSGGEAVAAAREEPRLFLGGGAFLSADGTIFRLTEAGAQPVLEADPALTYWGGSALLAFGGSQAAAYGWDGAPIGSYQAEGEVSAVTDGFALVQSDGGYRLVLHDFQPEPTPEPPPEEEPSPSPSVSPAPSPEPSPYPSPEPSPSLLPSLAPSSPPTDSPSPSPTPPVEVRGSWLYVSPGTSLEELRQLFWPDPVVFYSMAGRPVSEGLAGTGMTARKYTLIVPGDADGNGRVDQQDMLAGLDLLLRKELDGPQALALDQDGDEVLSLKDLLLFAQQLAGDAF